MKETTVLLVEIPYMKGVRRNKRTLVSCKNLMDESGDLNEEDLLAPLI